MSRLRQLYGLYEEHARAVDAFASVLWSEVDISKILEAAEDLLARLRKMTDLSEEPVFELVTKEIASFVTALPLMGDLKSDALRTRHWDALMAVRLSLLLDDMSLHDCPASACCHHCIARHKRQAGANHAERTLLRADVHVHSIERSQPPCRSTQVPL